MELAGLESVVELVVRLESQDRWTIKYAKFITGICCVAFQVCGCERELPAGVGAKVGARSIAQEDLRVAAQQLHGAVWDSLQPAARTGIFEAVVAAELLVMEGVRRGLDRDPEIEAELATLWRRELSAAFFERDN